MSRAHCIRHLDPSLIEAQLKKAITGVDWVRIRRLSGEVQ